MTEGRVSELDMIAETFKTEEQRGKRLKKKKKQRTHDPRTVGQLKKM